MNKLLVKEDKVTDEQVRGVTGQVNKVDELTGEQVACEGRQGNR